MGNRMMLVEDNLDERILIKRKAGKQNLGVDFIEATDGQNAINQLSNMAKEDLPDLILLDLKMPKVDGHEVLSWIRSHHSTKRIPVVIFSTSDDQQDIAKSYELGANSYVVKDIKNPKCLDILCIYWTTLNRISANTHD